MRTYRTYNKNDENATEIPNNHTRCECDGWVAANECDSLCEHVVGCVGVGWSCVNAGFGCSAVWYGFFCLSAIWSDGVRNIAGPYCSIYNDETLTRLLCALTVCFVFNRWAFSVFVLSVLYIWLTNIYENEKMPVCRWWKKK